MKLKTLLFLPIVVASLVGCKEENYASLRLYYDDVHFLTHSATYNEIQHFEIYEKFGYSFQGYYSKEVERYCDENGDGYHPWQKENPTDLYAKYNRKDYIIQLNLDGGNLNSSDTFTIQYDSDISYLVMGAPYKSGYRFVGYYTAPEGGKQITDGNANFIDEAKYFSNEYYSLVDYDNIVNFYARYEDKIVEYHLLGLNEKVYYRVGDVIDYIPYEIKDNMCFVGYYLDSEFQKRVSFPYVIPESDRTITLYPRYEECTAKGLSYADDTDDTYIANYAGSATEVYIPDSYMGKLVTKIGYVRASSATLIATPQTVTSLSEESFMNCSMCKEIILPSRIDSLPKKVFYNCRRLEAIELSSLIKEIKDEAFYNCERLKELNLPLELESIAKTAFIKTNALERINVSEANRNFLSIDGVLYLYKSEKAIQLVKYPNKREGYHYTLNERTTKICDYAFSYTSLRKVEASSSLNSIGTGAFMGCELLTFFRIEDAQRLNVSRLAFSNCPVLTTLIFDVKSMVVLASEDVFEDSYSEMRIFVTGSVYNQYLIDAVWKNFVDKLMKMTMIFGDYCIEDYHDGVKILAYFGSDSELIIPDYLNGKSVLAIGEYAFVFNEYLESVELNEELELIQDHAFENCTYLESVYIYGNTVKEIEGNPFESSVYFYLMSSSNALLQEYKSTWTQYSSHIYTAH